MALAVYITNARDAIDVMIVPGSRQEVVIVSPTVRDALPIRIVGKIDGAIPVTIVGQHPGQMANYSFLGTLGGDFLGISPQNDFILVTGV